jgi:hypothetical protein
MTSKLLPQPGGFEAVGALRVLLKAEGLAALVDGEDVSHLHVNGNPTGCTVAREPDPNERSIAIGSISSGSTWRSG